MKDFPKMVWAVPAGLCFAVFLQPLLDRFDSDRNVSVTKSRLRAIQTAVAIYCEVEMGTQFDQRQPPSVKVLEPLIPADSLYSPCLATPQPLTQYWTGLTGDGDFVLASNLACGSFGSWGDPLAQKRGLGITRSGILLDITAYGDPAIPEWWTDPNARL